MQEALRSELHGEQFGADIVMVEDEFLAHELEGQDRKKQQVRRIAGLHHVEAPLARDLQQKPELVEQRGCVFQHEARFAARLERQRMTVDGDVVEHLERGRIFVGTRADDRDGPARVA